MSISQNEVNEKYLPIIRKWTSRKNKTGSLSKQFSQKHSDFRNALSCLLRLWNIYRSLITVSKLINVSPKYLSNTLQYSARFKNRKSRQYGRKMKNEIEFKNMEKWSKLRNEIALCLKTWRKLRSVDETARLLKIKVPIAYELLAKSKVFANRRRYTTKEKEYAHIWAMKLMAIKTLGGKCNICGNKNPIVLELHHINPENKEKCFSDMVRKNSNYKSIKKEIQKCKLYCRNCHQELHNIKQIPKNLKNKKFILQIQNNNCKCVSCGYGNNISCLEFHHKNKKTKKLQLSSLTDPRRNYSKMKISNKKFQTYVREIKKCIALCCNCHQIAHTNTEKIKELNLLIQIFSGLTDRNYMCRL